MDIASATPLERRFIGATRLVTLHLWRVAKSTDLDEGFACARSLGMIDEANETFIRECFEMAAALEESKRDVVLEDGKREIASEDGASAAAGMSSAALSSSASGASAQSQTCAEHTHAQITSKLIDELQACVLRLNSADPA